MTLFNTPTAGILTSADPAALPRATITVAGVVWTCPMVDISGGEQGGRVQVEATADGLLHAIGLTSGIGKYRAVFYDGPLQTCEANGSATATQVSAMGLALKQDNTLADKLTVVRLFPGGAKESDTSKALAVFTGIMNNVAIDMREQQGLLYYSVAVDIIGGWNR